MTHIFSHKRYKLDYQTTVLMISPRTVLLTHYFVAHSACINVEVFIYSVKINVGPESITSWEPVHCRLSYINLSHPPFLHDPNLLPTSSFHGCYFLLSSFRHLIHLTASPPLSLTLILSSYFPSRTVDTTSDLQFENYSACHFCSS